MPPDPDRDRSVDKRRVDVVPAVLPEQLEPDIPQLDPVEADDDKNVPVEPPVPPL